MNIGIWDLISIINTIYFKIKDCFYRIVGQAIQGHDIDWYIHMFNFITNPMEEIKNLEL